MDALPRRESLRLRDYDYAQPGMCFVTVCTRGRGCFLGSMIDDAMQLNAPGSAVRDCWRALPASYSQVALDEFVVMPNHVHGIVVLGQPGAMNRAPTALGEVVRAFTACCTRMSAHMYPRIHRLSLSQPNFHEHVIRNERDLYRIREYICRNPVQWAEDRNNPKFGPSGAEGFAKARRRSDD